ncbi:hypothetical protein NUU61_005643 [Penicillium alfredii]|uniref:gamma-glutamylcyclotransferase n=1 Tax=Penicillium alfredii TaxID=1506179 RepID=A0A9W9K8U3_9EURO|nr:uncharacterized protein NUU61_005643 [Penicillium alfredii]KAJ5096287.1 hypothetical protein NUU61_005643 [Penicillium alfredii]
MHINIGLGPKSETVLPVSTNTDADTLHGSTRAETKADSKHLYFAYGSNLSPTQMEHRCTFNPTLSAKPVAIALLPKWRWLICEAGYANVLPPEGMRIGPQDSELAQKVPISGAEDAVYGVLYEMDPRDEQILDVYEGVDPCADETDGSAPVGPAVRPRNQGEGSYNKWYVSAPVVQWLQPPPEPRDEVSVLVYVDEERVCLAPPKFEYIARMNRAIREAEGLGVPAHWIRKAMRRFIPDQ